MAEKYLLCRNGNFHFHKRVPKDLIPTLGKEFIRKSLKTNSKTEAIKISYDLLYHLNQAFNRFNKDIRARRKAQDIIAEAFDSALKNGLFPPAKIFQDTPSSYPTANRISNIFNAYWEEHTVAKDWMPKTPIDLFISYSPDLLFLHIRKI